MRLEARADDSRRVGPHGAHRGSGVLGSGGDEANRLRFLVNPPAPSINRLLMRSRDRCDLILGDRHPGCNNYLIVKNLLGPRI